MPDRESFADMGFPLRGVDQSKAFGAQQPGTTPLGVNVRGYEPASRRAKGGARPGLAKYLSAQLPNGAHMLQNLNVVDPTSDAALLSSQFDWTGLPSGGIGDPAVASSPPPPPVPLTIPGYPAWQFDPSTPGWGPGHVVTVQVPISPGGGGGSGGSSPPVFRNVPANSDWGSTTLSDGVQGRDPSRIVPVGGTGAQPSKNKRNRTKRTPTINWSDPNARPLGTILTSIQLNATATDPVTLATVPGTFRYTPAAGTATTTDPQALYVFFTPSDLTAYTVNAATVNIGATVGFQIQQSADSRNSGGVSGGSYQMPFVTQDVTAGSLLLFEVMSDAYSVLGAVTDSQGNTWVKAVEKVVGAHGVALWYAVAGTTGPCTVSIVRAAGSSQEMVGVLEYSSSGTPRLDGTSSGSGTGTSLSTGAIPVATATDLAIGVFSAKGNVNPNLVSGTGLQDRFQQSTDLAVTPLYYIDVGEEGGISAGPWPTQPSQVLAATDLDAASTWVAAGATFK